MMRQPRFLTANRPHLVVVLPPVVFLPAVYNTRFPIRRNDVGDQGVSAFAECLANNFSLSDLDLS